RARNVVPGEHFGHAGIDAALDHKAVRLARLQKIGEVAALDALLPHPDEARIEGEVVAGGAGAEHDHAAALHDEAGDREGLLARMLEDEIDVVALAGEFPDRLAELAHLLHVLAEAACGIDVGETAPAIELLAVDDAFGAELHDEITLLVLGNDGNRIGTRGGDELDRHRAQAAGGAPDEHVVPGPEHMRAMAEEHAISGGEGQHVAAALLPCQVLGPLHELAALDAGELSERAVGRLVAPDAL